MWRNSVYLAHWIYYGRGQERMAVSALDEAAGLVRLVHVLSPLPPAVAALRRASGQAAAAHAASLSDVEGSTWEREKNWGPGGGCGAAGRVPRAAAVHGGADVQPVGQRDGRGRGGARGQPRLLRRLGRRGARGHRCFAS